LAWIISPRTLRSHRCSRGSRSPGSSGRARASPMSSEDFSIRIKSLSKRYEVYAQPADRLRQMILPRVQRVVRRPARTYFSEFWAVRDVSFNVRKGETVGIVGRNGSGKSTLLQMICGTLNPTLGRSEER